MGARPSATSGSGRVISVTAMPAPSPRSPPSSTSSGTARCGSPTSAATCSARWRPCSVRRRAPRSRPACSTCGCTRRPRSRPAAPGWSADWQRRFLLGLGVSHAVLIDQGDPGSRYVKPFTKMRTYLDELDAAAEPYPVAGRVLAALGPRMLGLARDRAAGVHPYFVPPEHVARARSRRSRPSRRGGARCRPRLGAVFRRVTPRAITPASTPRCRTTRTTSAGSASATTTSPMRAATA